MKDPCSVDGCETAAITRGWCQKHYRRWKRHGDPGTARPYGQQSEQPVEHDVGDDQQRDVEPVRRLSGVAMPDGGFDKSGRQLWQSITRQFVLDNEPHKLELLAQACRATDTIAMLEREQCGRDLLVPGSRPGQKVISPLVDQARQQRQLLSVLITKLQLPEDVGDDEVAAAKQFRVERARAGAKARWSARTAG